MNTDNFHKPQSYPNAGQVIMKASSQTIKASTNLHTLHHDEREIPVLKRGNLRGLDL
jgi:hypothetical protein